MTVVAAYECLIGDSNLQTDPDDAADVLAQITAHLAANPLHSYKVMLRWVG